MKLIGGIIFVYGIFMILGGAGAFLISSDVISLAAAVLCGSALILSSGMIKKSNFIGVYLSLIISFGLATYFGLKYSKYNHIMPDGILTILSMFAIGYSVYALSNKEQYTNDKNSKNEAP